MLAQIPDLSVDDSESLMEEHAATTDGRLISQSLASKLVLGGGILLVVAAVLPFTMAKTTQQKPADNGLSQWHSSPAPEADVAPGWNVGGQTAADHGTATGPQRSVVVEAVPTGLGANVQAPPWTDNTHGSLAAKSPTPAVGNNPAVPNLPVQMPQSGTSVEMNRPMMLGQGPGAGENGRPVYQADKRNDRANTYRSDHRGSQSPGVNPVMPDLNGEFAPQGPGATQPPPATQTPSDEQQSPPTDTARLDGIIPIPPNQDHP